MSNSTFIEEEDYVPRKTFAQQREERLEKKLDDAYDLIVNLVKDDPEEMCETVREHYPMWCKNNCDNFNKDCLSKFMEHYDDEK